MRRFGLLVLLITLQGLSLAIAQEGDCAGLVMPLLSAGISGRVRLDDGVGLVLHEEAAKNSPVIANLPEGSLFLALDGAICAEGWVWWQVRLPDLQEGYLAEGNATLYFAEPYETGAHLFFADAANVNQINHLLVDAAGQIQQKPPLILSPQGGTAGSLWQSFEISAANLALADRLANCADRVPAAVSGDVSNVIFDTQPRTYYPSQDGSQVLIFRDYLVDLPHCDGQGEQFGTTYVYLADPQQGERLIFPYSQKSDPPPGQFCQPPTVRDPEYATYIDEVAWSQDGRYAALGVRYLRNSQLFPCAFYHIFVIDTLTLNVQYIGEGQRIGWGYNGLLYFARMERADPNTPGVQHFFTIRPNGEDRVEVFIPASVMLISELDLPYNATGERLLACTDVTCTDIVTFSLRDFQVGSACAVPVQGRAYFVKGDQDILWLGEDGTVHHQRACVDEVLAIDGRVTVISMGLMGAALRLENENLMYYDWQRNAITLLSVQ